MTYHLHSARVAWTWRGVAVEKMSRAYRPCHDTCFALQCFEMGRVLQQPCGYAVRRRWQCPLATQPLRAQREEIDQWTEMKWGELAAELRDLHGSDSDGA